MRPVAISSSIRRLVASAVCRQYAPDFAADFLSTLQFGVATPGGVEQLVKSLEIHLQQNQDWCVLKTDFSNAFNSVDREFAIRQLKTFYPGLFPFVASCYRGPGPLFFGSGSFAATLYSQNGIHQGDPLGPLLFSLAIEPIIAQVNRELGSNVSPAFLDDLFLVGLAAAVLEVLSNLREWGSKISLNLRIDNCQLYLKPGHHLPTNRQGLTVNREGLIILGTPIGSDKFIQESCLTQVHESQLLLDKICELPNIQSAFLMLRYCATGSLAHLNRSVPPHLLEQRFLTFSYLSTPCSQS